MKNYLEKVKETVQNIETYDREINALINERKLKLSMVGVNEVVRTLAELIVLESTLHTMQGLVERDDDGIFLMNSNQFETQIPGTNEILGYLSMQYQDDLSDECVVTKAFVNAINMQQVTGELLGKVN